jgi:hypothetical protein
VKFRNPENVIYLIHNQVFSTQYFKKKKLLNGMHSPKWLIRQHATVSCEQICSPMHFLSKNMKRGGKYLTGQE